MSQLKPIIKINNLDVVYNQGKNNEVKALQSINCEIYPEEYIVFYGPSGCGKSTLLNIIAALEVPTSGLVIVNEKEPSFLSQNELAQYHRDDIGMIFQAYNLLTTLSVLDNVILPGIFNKLKKKERLERGRALLESFGILDFANRLPQELSGGQQQRVGIARALINNPKILLADEPIGNLDSKSAENVLQILNHLNKKEKKTIILVTHSPENLIYADRIFHIKDGKIIKEEVNKTKPDIAKQLERTTEVVKRSNAFDRLMESYPELSENQLNVLLIPFKSKVMTAYLTTNFEEEVTRRLEKFIENRLYERIQSKTFQEFLDAPFSEGGVGLNKQTAERFVVFVEDTISKAKFLKREVFGSHDGLSTMEFKATELARYFVDFYQLNIEGVRFRNFKNAIRERLLNKISKKKLKEFLDVSFEEGGASLDTRAAQKIARHMELILLVKYGM